MELRYYLSTLGRRKGQIFLITLLVTLITIAATMWLLGTSTGSAGALKTSDFVLDFFYGSAGWGKGLAASTLAAAIGIALV